MKTSRIYCDAIEPGWLSRCRVIPRVDFATSDPHFCHKNILKYEKRPFANLDEMHEALIENWNSVVRPHHRVLVDGDMGFWGVATGQKFVSRLNGYKILQIGNHDEKPTRSRKIGFAEVYTGPSVLETANGCVLTCHFPYRPSWWHTFKERYIRGYRRKYTEYFPPLTDMWLIHGHVHTRYKEAVNYHRKMINVGVDVPRWNWKPVPMAELESIISGADTALK